MLTCELCKQKDAIGFCGVCRRPACDRCSKQCIECGKTVCKEHARKSKSGRVICESCEEDRAEAPKETAPAETSFEALQEEFGPLPSSPPPREEAKAEKTTAPDPEPSLSKPVNPADIDDNRPVLTASAYQPPSQIRHFVGLLVFGVLGGYFFVTSPALRGIMFPFGNTRQEVFDWILFGFAWAFTIIYFYSVWVFVTTYLRSKGVLRSKYFFEE